MKELAYCRVADFINCEHANGLIGYGTQILCFITIKGKRKNCRTERLFRCEKPLAACLSCQPSRFKGHPTINKNPYQ